MTGQQQLAQVEWMCDGYDYVSYTRIGDVSYLAKVWRLPEAGTARTLTGGYRAATPSTPAATKRIPATTPLWGGA